MSDDLATMRAVELRARKELLSMGLGRCGSCQAGPKVWKVLPDICGQSARDLSNYLLEAKHPSENAEAEKAAMAILGD